MAWQVDSLEDYNHYWLRRASPLEFLFPGKFFAGYKSRFLLLAKFLSVGGSYQFGDLKFCFGGRKQRPRKYLIDIPRKARAGPSGFSA